MLTINANISFDTNVIESNLSFDSNVVDRNVSFDTNCIERDIIIVGTIVSNIVNLFANSLYVGASLSQPTLVYTPKVIPLLANSLYVSSTLSQPAIVDVTSVTPLLDVYGTASIGFSLRKLKSTSTNVVRVRRSSDNVEQNFTADEITNGTLTTFTGASDGFVPTWYDQSGNNNHAVQPTAEQPKIVSAGALILDNGKPCLNFDGVDDGLVFTSAIPLNDGSNRSNGFVLANPKTDALWGIYTDQSAVYPIIQSGNSGNIAFNYENYATYVDGVTFTGTRNDLYLATTGKRSLISSSFGKKSTTLGFSSLFNRLSFELEGNVQEVVHYNFNNDTNRVGIQNNINDFY